MISTESSKSSLIVFLLLLLPLAPLFSQVTPMQDRLKAQQAAFFTQKLSLTPEESRTFWPVYDDYSNRRENLRIEGRNLLRSVARNSSNMSDEEISETMKEYIENQNREHDLFLEYNKKFMNVLPAEKVMMIYVAENQFKQYLLDQIRENRRGRGPGGR